MGPAATMMCLLAVAPLAARALDNGLGLAPAMGWNTWNTFGGSIDAVLVEETAAAMVARGFAAAGYEYVVVDDCWSSGRGAEGQLVPDAAAFPRGMRALADAVHARGLKFGLYGDAGLRTCAGRPGSLGREAQDARTLAAWGVDFLKYDNCYPSNGDDMNSDADRGDAVRRYTAMRDALNATGRPIHYSISEWGCTSPWLWAPTVANSWRTTGDSGATWGNVLAHADSNAGTWGAAAPGAFNDPDMLEVGVGALTLPEQRTHFSMWVVMKAPLILGCDVRSVGAETVAVLTNAEAIAVNQDELGVQARRARLAPGVDAWVGPLSGGRVVLLLVSRDGAASVNASWKAAGIEPSPVPAARDVWGGRAFAVQPRLVASLGGHDCLMLVMAGVVVARVGEDGAPNQNVAIECTGPHPFPEKYVIVIVVLGACACASATTAIAVARRRREAAARAEGKMHVEVAIVDADTAIVTRF